MEFCQLNRSKPNQPTATEGAHLRLQRDYRKLGGWNPTLMSPLLNGAENEIALRYVAAFPPLFIGSFDLEEGDTFFKPRLRRWSCGVPA